MRGVLAVNDKLESISEEPVRISDYVMEGGLGYTIQILSHPAGCELIALGMGINRDKYIKPAVRHYIQAANIPIVEESA
jgi:hypothetical protein